MTSKAKGVLSAIFAASMTLTLPSRKRLPTLATRFEKRLSLMRLLQRRRPRALVVALGELHFESEWDALRQRTVARTAIAALARYLADFEARGGDPAGAVPWIGGRDRLE